MLKLFSYTVISPTYGIKAYDNGGIVEADSFANRLANARSYMILDLICFLFFFFRIQWVIPIMIKIK